MRIESSGIRPNGWNINDRGQGEVEAISVAEAAQLSRDGKCFSITSDFINISAASAILYIENTTDVSLALHMMWLSGDVSQRWSFVKNPTGGTIVTTATVAVKENTKWESGLKLAAKIYKGAAGATLTGGAVFAAPISPSGTMPFAFNGAILISPGGTFGISTTPSAAGNVAVSLLLGEHLKEE